MMKRPSIFCLVAFFSLNLLRGENHEAQSSQDHLVPVEKEYGSGADYEKLWTKKLLVTPGEIARFVFLPGNVDEESAVSVYRKENGGKAGFWVTVTQPSARIWDAVPQQAGSKPRIDPRTITVDRCDLPLPDSTALAIGKAWLAMLLQSRPMPKSESIPLDNTTEIFSATSSSGAVLRAQIPSGRSQPNNSALLELGNSLIEYCNVPESRRPEKARKIEKDASDLLKRVTGKTEAKTN